MFEIKKVEHKHMVMKHQHVLQPLPDYARQRTTVSNVRTWCTISINNIGVRYTTHTNP